MTPENARANLAAFELQFQHRLATMSQSERDRWDQQLVKMLGDLGIDLDDPTQAASAFAGAYMMMTTLIPGALIPMFNGQTAAAIARGLLDRADAGSFQAELESWLKEQ